METVDLLWRPLTGASRKKKKNIEKQRSKENTRARRMKRRFRSIWNGKKDQLANISSGVDVLRECSQRSEMHTKLSAAWENRRVCSKLTFFFCEYQTISAGTNQGQI